MANHETTWSWNSTNIAHPSSTDQSQLIIVSTSPELADEHVDLQRNVGVEYSPAIFLLGLVAPVSFFGNILVLVVYQLRFKPSATRSFILTVASLDLICTTFALPMEIYSLVVPYDFPSPVLCKLYVFAEQFTTSASVGTLVIIAVHRHRKICTPLKRQMSIRIARGFRLCALVFALGLTWPSFILYGDRTVQTPYSDVKGHTCGIQDYFTNSDFPIVYRCVFLSMFCIGAIPVTILYILVVRKVLLLRRCKCKAAKALPYQKVMREMMSTVKLRSSSEENGLWKPSRVSASSLRYSRTQSKMFSFPKRTTLMIAVTTFVIFVSFVPNIILRLIEQICENFVSDMNGTSLSAYHTFLRFYYFHCATNPIIYSVLSSKFREELRILICGKKETKTRSICYFNPRQTELNSLK